MTHAQRLLIFNLRTDADDHILGFTTGWINALAPYFEAVDVLTMHKGRLAVAPNVQVYSVGREDGLRRHRRTRRFYGYLRQLLASHHYNAAFAHMQPLFAVMGAPLLRVNGVPLTTWYTHRQVTRQLKLATAVSRRIVTAVPSSFPIVTPKVRALGHGIDTDFYLPPAQPATTRRLVYVARLTDIKNQHILLLAAEPLPDLDIVLVGDIPDGYDDSYKRRLSALVDELGMRDRVTFAGAQTPEQVRDWYQGAAVAVNLAPAGLFDKAALEAMACGVPTIVSNLAFSPTIGRHSEALHISAPDDIDGLRARLRRTLALSPAERAAMGADLRASVIQQHSLKALAYKLTSVLLTGELPADAG